MECGADDIILVTKDMTPQQIAKMAEEKLGCMPDITIECTGAEPCIQVGFCIQGWNIRLFLDWNLRNKIRWMPFTGWTWKRNG